MSWAKLDDGFHAHPKVRRAWREPRALGLHVLAMSYVAKYELDGRVPVEFIEDNIQDPEERDRVTTSLIEAALWRRDGEDYVIHDYLDYNPSRAESESKRKADRDRKREPSESKRNPNGVTPDSSRPRDGSGTGKGTGRLSSREKNGSVARAKVAGKVVTDAERETAAAVLAAFNEAADSAYTVDAHLTPLVGRIREHPDLDAEEHRRIIEANFADPWWSDRPGPQVIYGNRRQFERSIERAKVPVFGRRSANGSAASRVDSDIARFDRMKERLPEERAA